ncbi:MAG: hypothetical protein JWQ20_1324 [Conexibacter sp.]|jgi:LPXTG-motif cell wall-anchored protein|nr:hypothetical protein [Conexibacter sp.]
MKRMSRHTVVVLIVALLTSLGGMGVAVVAFGQDAADQDAGVPIGDYTGTTPRQAAAVTSPTSGYTTPAPTSGYTTPAPSTVTAPGSAGKPSPSETTPSRPTRASGSTPHAGGSSPAQPSRVTRAGPTRLAFTGAEPIALGGAGAALMLAGLGLHLRRRKATHQQA